MRSTCRLRRADAVTVAPRRRRIRAALGLTLGGLGLAVLGLPAPGFAYNHDQHQGIVALGYKAMVGAVMEKGCAPPFSFDLTDGTPSLRTYPAGFCTGDPAACQARWNTLLTDFERGIRYLRSIDSSLAPPRPGCTDPRGPGNTLGTVTSAVDRYYDRDLPDDRGFCGIPTDTAVCSAPVGLCQAGSIFQYLEPNDHTGDVLGYWAMAPDDDDSVARLGFKPTSALGLGRTIDTVNDAIETGVTALAVPFYCAWHFLSSGDLDCLDGAKHLADDAVPIEELSSIVPVIGEIKDADKFSGLWHFQNLVDGASNACDDRQGILYEEAGPRHVPDALDLAFVIIGDATGLTLNYSESTGPERFNITDPRDGDQPSCDRDRADWEFQTLGHTPFSPLDNLALYGWKRFANGDRHAEDLGWPLHAIGDAVAPHHTAGTTGWGHRPFEDAAELYWSKIIYLETPSPNGERIRLQYEQLRRILGWALHYAQALDQMRATHPTGEAQNEIPVRALITQVAADTLAETTDAAGAPLWPFDPTLSVPYVLDAAVKTDYLRAVYGTETSIDGMRGLLERGAGAAVALLASSWRVQGDASPPLSSVCDPENGMGFFACEPRMSCKFAIGPAQPTLGCCVVTD